MAPNAVARGDDVGFRDHARCYTVIASQLSPLSLVQKIILIACALFIPAGVQAQWSYLNSGVTAELRGLSIVDNRIVWASGARGTVLRSVDGGRTWLADSVPNYTNLDFRSIHALNDGSAFVASAGEAEKGFAKILATGDAGRHWNLVFSTERKGVFLDAIAFWDSKNGIALSDPVDGVFFLLLTSDGGRSWERVAIRDLPRTLPGEAAFAASGSSLVIAGRRHIWIGTGGGGRARVMRSADRGRSWGVAEVPVHADGPAAGIFALSFFDTKRGIAVGGDYTKPMLQASSVALTSDGGRTWTPAAAPPAAYLSGVAHASALDVIAVGLAGTFVSRDGGLNWTQTDTVPLNSVRFNGRWGVAVGPRGRVARTDDISR
jgi:photosystem II stability/assembly factor-like uncharacterized protein